jgi:hypothetical protein
VGASIDDVPCPTFFVIENKHPSDSDKKNAEAAICGDAARAFSQVCTLTIPFNPTGFSTPLQPTRSETSMSDKKTSAVAAQQPYEPIPFAKKHRISVEDAKAIIEKHGSDRKSADKEGRRVSV